MPLIGTVADDLTGATTTGVLLARSKARTAVFFNVEAASNAEAVEELDAIIISSNSRPLPANEAYDKVKDATIALKNMGVKYYQKRTDTTMRGGIGVEIDAMLDQLSEEAVAVVVPAMPQSRRILVGGYSVIDGVALINTPVAQDVRTPVKENYIPRLLAGQTRRKVGLVTLDKVLAGDEVIKEALAEQRAAGCQVIVADAITLEDVENIAQACIALGWDVVTVDPGPFTAKMAYHRSLIGVEEPNLPPEAEEAGKTVLIAAGSVTPVTKKQMAVLCEDSRHVRISVDPLSMIEGGTTALEEVEKAVHKALEYLESGSRPRAILFETALHGELLNLSEEDNKRHYAHGMSADRINAGLGMIISRVLEQTGRDRIAGLYTTGGDTMVNVCRQLGVECIEVLDYVIPQTDIGRLVGSYDGLPVVGKGGLTGNDHTACDIVDRLFRESERTLIRK
ncbi:D-erythronate kinase [Lachnospiraceae bacterium]|nr:D-erythronate kinase [Lachnospiraceae bacterium]